jgi:hypothetical protein
MEQIEIIQYFKSLQDQICEGIAKADGQGTFKEDVWTREEGGGGQSRVIQHGKILEKAGVNFSAVHGPLHPKMVTSLDIKEEVDFLATGVSIVMHPFNPWVPIIHMNVRYFELSNGQNWFGGGIDLTPHIIIPEQEIYEVQNFIDGSVLTIYDHPWPGMTPDLLSILLVVATQAKGSVLIHQKMFESRLFFVDKLIDMGAKIILCDPHRAATPWSDCRRWGRG